MKVKIKFLMEWFVRKSLLNKVSRDKLSLQNLKQLQLITKENIYIIWTKLYKDSKIVNCIKMYIKQYVR